MIHEAENLVVMHHWYREPKQKIEWSICDWKALNKEAIDMKDPKGPLNTACICTRDMPVVCPSVRQSGGSNAMMRSS